MKTKIQSTLKVTKNPLDESKMRLVRSMHVKTYLLNIILNIRMGIREVLKSTDNTSVLSSIRDELTIYVRKFSLSINGCRAGVTPGHASALQKINSVLSLAEEHAFQRTSNINAKEVVGGAWRVEVVPGKM
jgi:hypothetical protein